MNEARARRPSWRLALALAGAAEAAALGATGSVAAEQAEPSASPWQIELDPHVEVVPGGVATVRLTLRGRGRHVVARSGILIDLTAPTSGVSVRQRRYQRDDAVEPEAVAPTFALPVRGEAPGSYQLGLRLRFWVCTPRSCLPADVRRSVSVDVVDPPPPPPPPPDAVPDEAPARPRPARPAKPARRVAP